MRHDPTFSDRRIFGLPAAEYHAIRALSASGAWLLAEECAAKFLWRSPWNPLYVPEERTDFDIGVAAHLAVLEPERQAQGIVVIDRRHHDAMNVARGTATDYFGGPPFFCG